MVVSRWARVKCGCRRVNSGIQRLGHLAGIDRLSSFWRGFVKQEAANERTERKARAAGPKPAGRRLALVLAGVAPVAMLMVWMWVGH